MFTAVDDLEAGITELAAADPGVLQRLVIAEPHPDFDTQLVFQPLDDPQRFLHTYRDWLSRHLVLNELFALRRFITRLDDDGHTVIFAPTTAAILASYERWSTPIATQGIELRDYQTFSLNRALERAQAHTAPQRTYFWNWGAGAGKSTCSAIGAKALLDRGDVELVLAFTLSKLKHNLRGFFSAAGVDAAVADGTPAKRRAIYAAAGESPGRALVLNYEKSWVDFDALAELTAGKKVLLIADECHKVISEGTQNKSRKALDKLVRACEATVWPMSATVVGGNPLRYRDVFSVGVNPRANPLGTKLDFEDRYARRKRNIPIRARNGGVFTMTAYDWDFSALHDIRHRVADRTMAVRKTDPGVRESFKGLQTIVVPVQMNTQARSVYEQVVEQARHAKQAGEGLMPFYRLLRYICNTPEALAHTADEIGAAIATANPKACSSAHSVKIEMINDQLEAIREAGDKAVVFTHYTHLGLHLIAPHLKVPHVVHYGTGQSAGESQRAQQRFLDDPDITAFVSSDAGSHGLNLQCARYVIQCEVPYSYDDFMQRASRIDRADSHLDGLTNYAYITEDSVEGRVWRICNERRQLAEAVQGTQEALSYDRAGKSETDNLDWLIFGDK